MQVAAEYASTARYSCMRLSIGVEEGFKRVCQHSNAKQQTSSNVELSSKVVLASLRIGSLMKVAVIGDIHGNSAAFDAVLLDINKCGVDAIVNLGDHFSGPLDAKGTADRLLSRDMISILGNHDRWLLEQHRSVMGPSDLAADLQLEPRHKRWLSELSPTARLEDLFICHGTPNSDTSYWMEKVMPGGTVCIADQQNIERHAIGIDASVILCGHTHIPRIMRLRDGRLLVNPGSVGCPGYDDVTPIHHVMQTGTPDAHYAILERNESNWQVNLRVVQYDTLEMVKLAKSAERLDWASALETGWVSVA